MKRTLEQVRSEGLAALRERLGQSDMIRFLQQFDHGSGDYATERREWVDKTTSEEIDEGLAILHERDQND